MKMYWILFLVNFVSESNIYKQPIVISNFLFMSFQSLHDILPTIAEAETRAITLLLNDNEFNLPAGSYLFVEMFCNEKNCDCRRVIFSVFNDNQKIALANIGYGWESEAFYKKWNRSNDKPMARKMMKPSLNELSPQSDYARKILGMFNKVLLPSTSYLARVKAHYILFRKEI